jgi:hypothetical protein
MKFGFIAKHRSVWPAAWLCEALGVSRSGFAGLDTSMDETHICVLDREGAVVYESKTISTAGDCSRVGQGAELSSHRLRDRANGADPVPRTEPPRPPRGVHREPAGLPRLRLIRPAATISEGCIIKTTQQWTASS